MGKILVEVEDEIGQGQADELENAAKKIFGKEYHGISWYYNLDNEDELPKLMSKLLEENVD